MKLRAQGAFEYILLVGLVLALVVGIFFVLRGGLTSTGQQVTLQQCLAQLKTAPGCYNSSGGWVSNNSIPGEQYRSCGSSSETAAHGTCASSTAACVCGPPPV